MSMMVNPYRFGGGQPTEISFVGSKVAASSAAGNPWNIPLTDLTGGSDSAPQAGDLVLVQGSARITVPGVTGYATIQNLNVDSGNQACRAGWFWKRLTSADTSIDVVRSSSSGEGLIYTIHVFRGVDATTPFDVSETTASSTSAIQINPPSITPVTPGAWIYLGGANGSDAGWGNIGAPSASYLSGYKSAILATSIPHAAGSGYYDAWTSGAYDGAAFTGVSQPRSMIAIAVALKPAV